MLGLRQPARGTKGKQHRERDFYGRERDRTYNKKTAEQQRAWQRADAKVKAAEEATAASEAAKEASEAVAVAAVAEACAWQGKAEQLQQRLFAMPCRVARDPHSQVALEQERHRAVKACLTVEKKRRQTAEEELRRRRDDPCYEMMEGCQMMRTAQQKMHAARMKDAEGTRVWFSANAERMAAEKARMAAEEACKHAEAERASLREAVNMIRPMM